MMKKMTLARWIIVCLIAVTFSGCATVLSGTSQKITIDSEPQGALVQIGHQTGRTPVTMTIPKGKDYEVVVSVVGRKRVIPLTRTFDTIGFLNVLFFPGFIVDAATGALMKYEPSFVRVEFASGSLAGSGSPW